jgi:hypothetical protein
MKNKFFAIAITITGLMSVTNVNAQMCDTIATICAKHLSAQYISDGQLYRTLLLNDQTAEFRTTFYGGTTYRVCACTGNMDGNLIFTIKDQDGTVLFTNKDYKNAPYWDFKINSTIDCIIEASLNPDGVSSGCAVVLIGFKQ